MEFISKYQDYEVVIKPAKTEKDSSGNIVKYEDGIRVVFKNGRYKTEDKEIIQALKRNRFFGVDFWALEQKKEEQKKEN